MLIKISTSLCGHDLFRNALGCALASCIMWIHAFIWQQDLCCDAEPRCQMTGCSFENIINTNILFACEYKWYTEYQRETQQHGFWSIVPCDAFYNPFARWTAWHIVLEIGSFQRSREAPLQRRTWRCSRATWIRAGATPPASAAWGAARPGPRPPRTATSATRSAAPVRPPPPPPCGACHGPPRTQHATARAAPPRASVMQLAGCEQLAAVPARPSGCRWCRFQGRQAVGPWCAHAAARAHPQALPVSAYSHALHDSEYLQSCLMPFSAVGGFPFTCH